MKALIYSLIVASLVSGRALSADVPSLVGTWTGQRDRIAKVEGRRGGLATLVITQQQGNTFVGHLKRSNRPAMRMSSSGALSRRTVSS
jgi:hypothetical protein